mmetsp:Transcript_30486/g.76656  ORF Transcript_30486/g.76656 Transcript_30486/m.76656 type:complete len:477 (+) Transcript_30486:234-1664(+)
MRCGTIIVCLLSAVTLCASQQVNKAMVAQISTFPYEDALNKGGLSFETKDGSDLLRRRLLIASNGDVGFNLPEGSLPEASIHAAGGILAQQARFVDGVDALTLTATTNVTAHTVSASLGALSEVRSSSVVASRVEASDTVLTRDVEAAQVRASAGVAAHELSAVENVKTKKLFATELVNASEVVTTSIKTAGIPFDEVWESHANEMCQDQSDKPENAVAGADTADTCIAACMRVSSCAGVTFHPDPSLREGVEANCYMAFDSCVNITDGLTPAATVYHRPMVRVLDMADELLAAKAEIARLRSQMASLEATVTSFTESLSATVATLNGQVAALPAVATSGSYNDLSNKPEISSLSGSLAYSSLIGLPALTFAVGFDRSGTYTACAQGPNRKKDYICPGLWVGATRNVHDVDMPSATDRICVLSESAASELDWHSQEVGCKVHVVGSIWRLTAKVSDVSDAIDAYAECEAICFTLRY